MKLRRIISLTAFITFIVLAYTGIMLFICPHGRIAEWTAWKIFGMSKEEYGAVHTTFMVLFLITGIWHIVLNWKSIVNYLKDKSKKLRIFTPEFSLALVICIVIFVGTMAGLTPFRQFLGAKEDFKDTWEVKYGSPPWGHAELNTLSKFCRNMEDYQRQQDVYITLDPQDALTVLREAGIEVEGADEKLIDIAAANSTSPQILSDIILRAAIPVKNGGEPAPTGEGRNFSRYSPQDP